MGPEPFSCNRCGECLYSEADQGSSCDICSVSGCLDDYGCGLINLRNACCEDDCWAEEDKEKNQALIDSGTPYEDLCNCKFKKCYSKDPKARFRVCDYCDTGAPNRQQLLEFLLSKAGYKDVDEASLAYTRKNQIENGLASNQNEQAKEMEKLMQDKSNKDLKFEQIKELAVYICAERNKRAKLMEQEYEDARDRELKRLEKLAEFKHAQREEDEETQRFKQFTEADQLTYIKRLLLNKKIVRACQLIDYVQSKEVKVQIV
jgi:hypothetical protein